MNADFSAAARALADILTHRRTRRAALGAAAATLSLHGGRTANGSPDTQSIGERRSWQEEDPHPEIVDLAFELAFDGDAIFAFVRDSVGYDPYPGMLRGSLGVARGRFGNSLDQALLLSDLLRAAAFETRLVSSALSPEHVAGLEESLANSTTYTDEHLTHLFSVTPPEEPVVADADYDEILALLPEFAQFFQSTVADTAARTSDALRGALEDAGIAIGEQPVMIPDLEIERHVWVQARIGTEWVDLDPTFAEAQPGEIFTAKKPTELPRDPDLIHTVEFAFIAERVVGDGTERVDLLRHEAAAADLAGANISMAHPQPESFAALGGAITGAIEGFRNFTPNIQIDQEMIQGNPVTFFEAGSVGDALGSDGSRDGDTVAEWLEVSVSSPAGRVTERRTVFDRLDPALRNSGEFALSAVAKVEYADAGEPNPGYLPLAKWWTLSVVTAVNPATAATPEETAEPTAENLSEVLRAVQFARDAVVIADAQAGGARTFYSGPNVTAMLLATVDTQTTSSSVDMIHRHIGQVGAADDSGRHPLMTAGILAHAVEYAISASASQEPVAMPTSDQVSVAALFDRASAANVQLVVLNNDDDLQSLNLPAPAAERLRAALDAGKAIVIPERMVEIGGTERTGWWEIDPETGAAIDRMDDGGGVTLVEFALYLKIIACVGTVFLLGAAIWSAALYASDSLVPTAAEGSGNEFTAADAAAERAASAGRNGRNARRRGGGGAIAGAACLAL